MGDNLKINILKKLKNNKSNFILVPKDFVCRLQTRFSISFTGIWKEKYNSNWCFLRYNEVHFAFGCNGGIEGVQFLPIPTETYLTY
jgi:hypothetical protein